VKEQEEKKRQIEEAMFFAKVDADAEIRKLKAELTSSGKLEAGPVKEELDKELLELKMKCEEDKQKAIGVEGIRRHLEQEMDTWKNKRNAEINGLKDQITVYRSKFQEKAVIMEQISTLQQRRKSVAEADITAKKLKEELDQLENQGL
jgi:uncharacterized coiled-coil DUF342 family protein